MDYLVFQFSPYCWNPFYYLLPHTYTHTHTHTYIGPFSVKKKVPLFNEWLLYLSIISNFLLDSETHTCLQKGKMVSSLQQLLQLQQLQLIKLYSERDSLSTTTNISRNKIISTGKCRISLQHGCEINISKVICMLWQSFYCRFEGTDEELERLAFIKKARFDRTWLVFQLHKKPPSTCWNSGGWHFTRKCPFKTHRCHECEKQGHKKRLCTPLVHKITQKWLLKHRRQRKTHTNSLVATFLPNTKSNQKYVSVKLNWHSVRLPIDTASDITLISQRLWKPIGQLLLKPTRHVVWSASGDCVNITGELPATMEIEDKTASEKIYKANSKQPIGSFGHVRGIREVSRLFLYGHFYW